MNWFEIKYLPMSSGPDSILILDPYGDFVQLKGLASELRIRILELVHAGPRNVNDISRALNLPQSTIATNIMILEKAGLIRTETSKGRKGTQKMCFPVFREIVIRFQDGRQVDADDSIQVEMPVGLYTQFHVSAPCGLCTKESIIGYLDVPDSFLDPARMKAGLIWFEKGYLEYKFPNNSLYKDKPLKGIEISAELSSEVPGTNKEWLSDITLWANQVEVGTWTSPGDYGDRRGKYTPEWWKLEGSQYGLLKHWRITPAGTYVDGVRISEVTLDDIDISSHRSITIGMGIKETADHVGGMNIFGRGFGNYDQDIILRLTF